MSYVLQLQYSCTLFGCTVGLLIYVQTGSVFDAQQWSTNQEADVHA